MSGGESADGGPTETANRDGETPVVEVAETTDETTVTEAGTELERTIGLTGGVAIGVGTMIGAGIFVFPGTAAAFREVGATAETRLVFTRDEDQTVDRVADETDSAAILLANPAGDVERLFVPLGGSSDVDRIAAFVAALVDDRPIAVTLTHVAGEAGADAGHELLDDAAAAVRAAGVPDDAVSTEVAVSDEPLRTVATLGADHDAVIMGENQPSLRSFLFGDGAERVATASLGPVLVVRNERDVDEDEDTVDDAEGDE
jgi:nucleotide-binding universal stress UspA family protein